MSGMPVSIEVATIYAGGQSQAVSVSTTSAQSSAITNAKTLLVYSTVTCFIRQGTNPTAVSDGTDQFIPSGVMVRMVGFTSGNKLAIIATGSGTFYITPEK